MIDPRGTFEPYPYARDELRDMGRYDIELGHLSTPTGPSPYSIVRMRPFVCVLPVVEAASPRARMVLVRQFRYAVGEWQLEPPAGGVEDNEDPARAALRELREESGLLVEELVDLGWVYPSGGSTDERAYLYAARCSHVRVRTDPDKGEQVQTVLATRTQMEELLLDSRSPFSHAVTFAAWMRLASTGLLDEWLPR